MAQKNNRDGFVLQAGILAMAGIIVRIIGILYRSPLVAIIGDEGNGYYNRAYLLYTMILMVSTYGIPSAISKIISGKLAKREYRNVHRIFLGALGYVMVMGGIGSLVCFFFADDIVGAGSAQVLRIFAPTIFLSGLLGLFRGYFQAHKSMVHTSVSQVLEQIVNALVSLGAAYGLMSLVRDQSPGTQAIYGAMGSAMGTGAGVLTAFLFMLLCYGVNNDLFKKRRNRDRTPAVMRYKEVLLLIVAMVTPVILSTCIYNISSSLNLEIYCNLTQRLKGYTEAQATTLAGLFSGKANQITNIPIAISTAMSAAVIPTVSASFAKEDREGMKRQIQTAVKTTMMISIPAAVGLAVLAKPIVYVLYPQPDSVDLVAKLLQVLAVTVIFYGLSTISNGILQGTGYMNKPVIHSAAALIVQTAVLILLLTKTQLDLYSMAVATIVYSLLICILNGWSMRRKLDYRQEVTRTFIIPTVAALWMGGITFLVYYGMDRLFIAVGLLEKGRMNWGLNLIAMVLAVLAALPSYFAFLIRLGGVTQGELMGIPGGRTLAGAAKKIHLLK